MPHDSLSRSPNNATPSPHDASNPWGNTRPNGSHRATDILRAVLGDAGLPAGDAAVYEGLGALARAAQTIAGWFPDSPVWQDLASHLDEQTAARVSERNAYSSGIAPSRLNPLYGDFHTFPLYAGLVAGAQVPASTAWNFVAGLACWPFMHATLHGFPPPKTSANVVSAIYPLLREISTSPTTLRWLDGLLEGVTSPAGLLEAITRLPPKDQKSGRAKGLAELAHQFVLGQETPTTQAPGDEDDLPPPAYGTLLEKTPQDDATNDLAPDECGAAQSVLEIEGETDPTIVRARTIGATRDFNHLHLRWEALTSEEVEYFAKAYPVLIQDEATRAAAIGLAISAAAGIPLQDLAGIRLATSIDQGRTFAIAHGIAIVPLNDTLAVISSAPVLENAFKQAGKPGAFLPASPVKLTALPTSCVSVLQSSGWQPGETLARRYPTLAADARAALAAMRQKTSLRLTPGRLHPAIAKEIYTHTQDECVASLIHPAARIPVGAGRYYLAMTCQEIADIHCHASQSLFPGDMMALDLPAEMKHAHIGSQLVVDGSEIACALTLWRDRLEGKIKTGRRTLASVAEALNAHFIWLAVLVRLLAFVRPVIAPLPRPCDLDPEQGFLLACDKRESIRNEQRLVPLAGVLSEQVALTQETLTAAALFFDRNAPELAAQIRSLQIDGSACASIPALPYLEQQGGAWQFRELRPEDLSCPELAWPANFGRHFGIQEAHRSRLPREVVSMLVGHAEIGQTPFGWDSVLTPHDLQQICRPFLDELSATLKLKTLPALSRHSLGADEQPPEHVHIPLFGDDRPDRNARRRRLTLAEKQHLRNVGIHFATIATYSPEEATDEIGKILKSGTTRSPSELRWLKKIAERYLRFRQKATSQSQGDQTLKVPLEAEAGTVDRGELLLSNRGEQARNEVTRLTDTFLLASPEKAEPHKWIALIALNAIAFGGCLHAKAVEGIAKACVTGVRTINGDAFLDWKTDASEFRFWADAQTSALIARWLDTRTSAPIDLDLDAFRQELRLLLGKITALADAPYAWPASKTRLSRLRLATGAYMRRYVPGVLMAHMQGVRRSTPVPITCLQRELGLYLNLPSMQAQPLAPRPTSIDGNATTSAESAIAALRKRIAKIRPNSATGGASRGTRGERLRGLEADLNEVEASLNLLARDHGDSAITHIVIARARQLANKGGRLKKNLATSTISEYLAPVLRFAESPAGRWILTADPSELAEAYRTIILSGTPTKANLRYC